jgi:hypothetical protein
MKENCKFEVKIYTKNSTLGVSPNDIVGMMDC